MLSRNLLVITINRDYVIILETGVLRATRAVMENGVKKLMKSVLRVKLCALKCLLLLINVIRKVR